MSSSRSDHLTLGYLPQTGGNPPRSGSSTANTSPTEASSGSSLRSPFGLSGGLNSAGKMSGNTRSGAGSPSHEQLGTSSRIFSKRYVYIPNFSFDLANTGSTELVKYRHRKASLLEYGGPLPVADPLPFVKTYLNLQLMDFLISHIYHHQKICRKLVVPEQAQFPLDFLRAGTDSVA